MSLNSLTAFAFETPPKKSFKDENPLFKGTTVALAILTEGNFSKFIAFYSKHYLQMHELGCFWPLTWYREKKLK